MTADLPSSLSDTLTAFDADSREPLTTTEVAEGLDCSRRAAYDRLDRLADRGLVDTKKVGARGRVWWPTDGNRPPDAGGDGPSGSRQRRRLLETAPVPIVVLADPETVAYVNPTGAEFLGADDREEVVGETPLRFVDERDHGKGRRRLRAVFEDRTYTEPAEYRLKTVGGETRVAVVSSAPITFEGRPAAQVVLNDVTERKENERRIEAEKERFETLVDNLPGMVYRCRDDPDRPMEFVGGQCVEMTGYTAEELESDAVVWGEEVVAPEDREVARDVVREAIEDREPFEVTYRIETADGERRWMWERGQGIYDDGDLETLEAYVTDITERKERERELRRSERRYRRLVESAPEPIFIYDEDGKLVYANDAAVEFLAAEDRQQVLGVHAEEYVHPDDRRTLAERYRQLIDRRDPVPPTEEKLVDLEGNVKHAILASAPITYEGEPAIQAVATDVTDRKRQEEELKRQREQLATLNDLNRAVQRTSHAIVEADDREAIERAVCEQLAGADPYAGAWIGDWNDGDDVEVRAREGCAGDSEADVARAALRTGETRVYREEDKGGFESVATIPIRYGDVSYGVLAVCTSRSDAFEGRELDLVDRLGEVVGHAIAAVERREALLAERAVRLEFRSRDLLGPLVEAVGDREVTVDRAVPVDDGTLLYCSVDGADADPVFEALEGATTTGKVRRLDAVGDRARFEVQVPDTTVLSTLASRGARVRSMHVADGQLRIVAELSRESDVRRVVEDVEEAHPCVDLVSRERVDRSETDTTGPLDDILTDRQHAVLTAALQSGYFEQPRESTGQEVADSLDISGSTFHEHLRIGQRKLLEAVFSADT